ncbi:hypothetical protein [Leuconostoc mesenteroides]|uniref:hypothetical protein n=1 Tax=Leuconostoc mesenteroides TaxID=1245 RepID=UPI003BACB952
MSKQKLSIQEKNNKLDVQLDLLRHYAKMFDSGVTDMALPMATQVRVLIHQTHNSNSLLNQLDLINKFKAWHSPNSSFSPNNLLPSWDLLMMSIGAEGASYMPLGSKEVRKYLIIVETALIRFFQKFFVLWNCGGNKLCLHNNQNIFLVEILYYS